MICSSSSSSPYPLGVVSFPIQTQQTSSSSSSAASSTPPSSQQILPSIVSLSDLLRQFQSTEFSPLELQTLIKQYKLFLKSNPPSMSLSLADLLLFITGNEKKAAEPLILNFLLWQLAKERVLLHTIPHVSTDTLNEFSGMLSIILSSHQHLPMPLRGALHLLSGEIQTMQRQDDYEQPNRALIKKKIQETPQMSAIEIARGCVIRDHATCIAAISVSCLLDGNESRTYSLRDLLHHTRSDDPLIIIKKQLEAFQSGERTFIFIETDAVPIENYKMVMLYIIDRLTKDRTASSIHFLENEEELNVSIENMISQGKWDNAIPYQIEQAARQLIPLRENISSATSHQEIKELIVHFQAIYKKIRSANCHISICTCIDPKALSLNNLHKPVPVQVAPAELLNFAKNFGIYPTDSTVENHRLLLPFSRIILYANQPRPEALALCKQLEMDYRTLLLNKDREAMFRFLQTWCDIPSSDLLLSGDWRQHEQRESLKKLISAVEKQLFGFCKEGVITLNRGGGHIISHTSPIAQIINDAYNDLLNTHNDFFYREQLDPRKNPRERMIALKNSLQAIIDNPEYAEYAPKNKNLMAFFENVEKLLLNEPSQSYVAPSLPEHILLAPLKFALQSAQEKLICPIPEIIQGVERIKDLLENDQNKDLVFLRQLFTHLHQVKQSVQNALVNTLQYETMVPSLNLIAWIDTFFHEIGEKIFDDTSLSQEDKFIFLTEIAHASYYLDNTPEDPIGLKKRLTKIQEGYILLHQYTKEHFSNLFSLHRTHPRLVSTLQGSCNTEIGRFLSLLANPGGAQTELPGYCMQPAEVVGKVRFISLESDLSSIEQGDIVAIQRLPENGYHHFEKAAAIVSVEGGMFSHAAIIFSEMGIPALTGSSLHSLIAYDGKYIHLCLSECSHLNPLSEEETALFQNSRYPTLEAADSIERLSGTIKQVVAKQFYKRLFHTLPASECSPFLEFPSAQAYLEEQKREMSAFKKALWSTDNVVQRSYLLGKMNRLKELLFSLKILSLDELAAIDGEIQSLGGEHALNRFTERSGKLENLELLRPLMASMQPANEISFEVPSFTSFKAKELVWKHYPAIQHEIRSILDSSEEIAQKSASIAVRLHEIAINEQTVFSQWNTGSSTPWIVRSSSCLEDQAASSGAGIFESVSGNDLSAISDAIRKILISGFSKKALAYLLPQTATEKLFDMQFILQDYIADADYSGVAFSVKDEKQWDIAAMQVVNGVGGGVEGSQCPSYLFFDTSENQFTEIDTKQLPCKPEIAKEIAIFVKKLEAHFGAPVEIEFAGKGSSIFVVQVRPIVFHH